MAYAKKTLYSNPPGDASRVCLPRRERDGFDSASINAGAARTDFMLAVVFLLAACAQYFLFNSFRASAPAGASLAIEANISSGSTVELFVNGEFDRSYRAPIDPGKPARYLFTAVPRTIQSMRIDLTDVSGATVEVRSIEYLPDGGTPVSISSELISGWQTNQLEKNGPPTGAAFRTQGNDPWIFGTGLTLGADAAQPMTIAERLKENLHLVPAAVAFVLALTSISSLAVCVPVLLILLALHAAGPKLFFWMASMSTAPPSIAQSVGSAAYFGYAKQPEQTTFFLTLAGAVLVGMLFGILERRWLATPVAEEPAKLNWPILFGVVIISACAAMPQIAAVRNGLPNVQHQVSGFDWGNIFTWDFLSQYGFLPLRDYWFPYAGDYDQLGTTPAALWQVYLVQLVLCAALITSVYEISGRRMLFAVGALVCLLLCIESGVFLATKRYLASAAVVLSFGALTLRRPRHTFPYGLFGVLLGWCFWREPNQILYAAPALLLLAVIHSSMRIKEGDSKLLLLEVLSCFATAGAIIGVEIVGFLVRGQWDGFLDFYRRMGAMGATVSIPTAFPAWYKISPKFENIVLLGTHLLAAGGALILFGNRTYEQRVRGATLLGFGSLAALVFLKMLLRPHMAQQVLSLIYLGVILFAICWRQTWNFRQCAAMSSFAGCIFAATFQWPLIHDVFAQYRSGFTGFVTNAEAATGELRLKREQLDDYFSPARFHGLDADQKQVIDFLHSAELKRFSREIFVLGDDSYFYVLLKQKPCPYLSFYDGSNIFAQQEQIACIEQAQPRYVVWDSTRTVFDQVPNVVRVPLIFNYIVGKYIPERSFGRFQILRPRAAGEPFQWKFWTEKLGSRIELGALPEFSNAKRLPACEHGGLCTDVAVIENPAPVDALKFNVNGIEYSAAWNIRPSAMSAAVSLDRLWFWQAAKREGAPHSVIEAPGLKVESKAAELSLLY